MADSRSQFAYLSIEQIQANVAQGTVSAEEIVEAIRFRARNLDRRLHAFVEWVPTGMRCRGSACNNSCGVLCGVPIAIKDLFDYAGVRTRAGSTVLPDKPARKTATAVRRLEAAGAVILGKTHTVEFAFGGWGTNPVAGTPWNPWDLRTHRVPGGSSSGSAVAVAAGMATAALGTDTGGSIRTPASYCGIVGYKPSPGLVSRTGVFPLSRMHDTVGVLTRNVRDVAIMLSVISGPDPEDELTLNVPAIDFLLEIENGLSGLSIGVLSEYELAPVSEDMRRLYTQTLANMTEAGALPREFEPPRPLVEYLRIAGDIMGAESYAGLARYVDSDDSKVDPAIRARILKGREISANRYRELVGERIQAKREFLDRLDGIDALIMPTCVEGAIPLSSVDENRIVTPYGRFANLLDLAAISVPMGLTTDSLPAGLQIVTRQFDDALALRIARSVERSCGTLQPTGL
jgi:aspartyl-tRNA(Asn)/glutamyl-tRNA(Gln) amidotransferase subunit A